MWSFSKSKQTTEGFTVTFWWRHRFFWREKWAFICSWQKNPYPWGLEFAVWESWNPTKFLFKTTCQNMSIRGELTSKKSKLWFAFSKVTLHHFAINIHGWSWMEKNRKPLTVSPSQSMDLWWFRKRNHGFLSSNKSGNSSNFKMQSLPSADVYLKISPTIHKIHRWNHEGTVENHETNHEKTPVKFHGWFRWDFRLRDVVPSGKLT